MSNNTNSKSMPAGLSKTAASVLLDGPVADTFYEDLAAMRKMADLLIAALPKLAPQIGMARAAAGFAAPDLEPPNPPVVSTADIAKPADYAVKP